MKRLLDFDAAMVPGWRGCPSTGRHLALPSPGDPCLTPPETALRTLQLLYVEDNEDLRESISVLLESDVRHVVTCATAEDALEVMARQHVDVLVTDVSLPGMSGTDLARRWLAPDPRRWVVLCSGYDFGDKLRLLGPNVRGLSKGFDLEHLERLLDEIDTSVRAADSPG